MKISEFINILSLCIMANGDANYVSEKEHDGITTFSINVCNNELKEYLKRVRNYSKVRKEGNKIDALSALNNYTGLYTIDLGFKNEKGEFISSKNLDECEYVQEYKEGVRIGKPKCVGKL